ncbi:MAG: NAD(+)/NADH kinase [Balneolaceae bacterium]|nr:NAD(+)/NADH kinase [Balneolaceae bacterium]
MPMTFSIIANPDKYSVEEPIYKVLEWCRDEEILLSVPAGLAEHYPELSDYKSAKIFDSEQEAVNSSGTVIAVGGDGTILHTAQLVRKNQTPVLGINTGKLGFMANIQPENIEQSLKHVKEGNYTLDNRAFLKAELPNGKRYDALNEFLFTRKDSSSMISLNAEYDGVFINNYWADGLIVSTPTGSTAYNLSAGGPIIMPNTPVMVLTPINPHTLTTRPLVLPSNKPLRISSQKSSEHTLFTYDGMSHHTESNLNVTITQSEYSIHLIQLPGQNYFETLRNKLMWGLDRRKE